MPDATGTPSARDVVRIVLADDHPIVREGLKHLLESEPDMRVIDDVADGEAAWRSARALAPDVLVLDLSMPVLDGAETAARVARDCPGVKVLALTVHEERTYLDQLMRAGARGFVLKRAAPSELVNAVRAVAGGGTYIDPSIAGPVVRGYLEREAGPEPHVLLTERERDVLVRIARGFSNKEIAAELEISVKTVETYKARVSEKLGLRGRVDIVRYAAHAGWLHG